ncbi:MAG: SHD1 domain-containing protein, partial [Planctomycetota bacterium]|nr:SHD1 domain-containing protein [Planctomycetota bacterium]
MNSIVQAGEMRTWIDRTGKHKIKAELVSYEKGNVTLKTAEGKLITLVVFKLSKPDREFVYKFHNPEYGKRKSRESASDDAKGGGTTDGDDATTEDDSTEIDESGKSKTEGGARATKSKKDRSTRRPLRGKDRDRVARDQESPSSSPITDSVSEPGQQKVEIIARAQSGGAIGEEEAAPL